MRALAAAALALAAIGCYHPQITDGALLCAADNKCPQGMHCGCDGACYHAGKDPASCSGGDGGTEDMSESDGFITSGNPGDPCVSDDMCSTGFCSVDGVCCDSKCDGACQACNLPGTPGTCTDIPAGTMPQAGHADCGPDPQSTCMRDGTCDGHGACQLWLNNVCTSGSCNPATNSATGASKCDGAGHCVTPNSVTCDPFLCDANNVACLTTCSGNSQCKAPATCNNMSCGTKANGSPCTAATQCTSGNCIDGFCCDGTCTGKCQACDTANVGVCSPVTSGQPHGTRGNCAGFGTSCSGSCAAGTTATCSFPGNGLPNVTCANQSCVAPSTQGNSAQCNGAGACSAQTQVNCAPFACSNNACLTSCSIDSNCASATPFCNAPTCKSTKPNGRACSAPSECTSGICVDGVCCGSACTGQCQRCDTSPGNCTNTGNGTAPVNGRPVCGAGIAACDGTCDGNGSCGNFPPSSVACTDATGGPGFCNGAGTCVGTGCFLGDTLVDTNDGLRPIASIVAGDLVRSFDVFSGDNGWHKVTQVQTRRSRSLITVALGNGTSLDVTPEHYFWVLGSGWVRALELSPDDRLMEHGEEPVAIVALSSRSARPDGAEVDVYNLVVEGVGTYFVGDKPVLVESCDYVNFSHLGSDDLPE